MGIKKVVQAWNSVSLVKRIVIGLVIGGVTDVGDDETNVAKYAVINALPWILTQWSRYLSSSPMTSRTEEGAY